MLNFFPLTSYVLVSTFTPGPANLSSASNGVRYGYRETVSFQIGLSVGVFLMMFLSGLVSLTLLELFPALESILRVVGALYIAYLAIMVLKAGFGFTEKDAKPLGFVNGLVL